MKTGKMKGLLSYLLVICMIAGFIPAFSLNSIAANEIVTQDGIHFRKSLVTDLGENQPEVLKIEAWTEGNVSTGSMSSPADIILVLDQSGSMDDAIAGSSQSKLQTMKNAVETFAARIKENNTDNNDKYRIAIVGFASEDENTEILTGSSVVEYNGEYVKYSDGTQGLDTSENYYIKQGSSYLEISYFTPLFAQDGWYTVNWYGGRDDAVPSDSEIYVIGNSGDSFKNAFVNCTDTEIASSGAIGKAIAALDGNGATRADLGFYMAKQIFENQDADVYSDGREKIVVFLTDGVPTTATEFSSSVANQAIEYAKELKDENTHIFSLFLGTPSSDDSVNFMQGVSSNYPAAQSYTELGDKSADSYYSSHTDTEAITNVFTDIAISVSAPSRLNEKSVIADSLSEYFTLPSVDSEGSFNESQIYVYTVDWTGTDWKKEEGSTDVEKRVRFEQASVTIDDATKTVKVSGFNFKHHCITTTPKDGNNDYGRKLVFYIPIIRDQETESFGGYLPTNKEAYIKELPESTENSAEVDGCYKDTPIEYSIRSGTHYEHLEEGSEPIFYYNEKDGVATNTMNNLLTHMIHVLPDGMNNIGVNMLFELYDEDGHIVAEKEIPAGKSYSDEGLLDFNTWVGNPGESKQLEPWVDNISSYEFSLKCTLKSETPGTNTLEVQQPLHVMLTKDHTKHIINGRIDENGTVTVGGAASRDYTEEVIEGEASSEMTFEPKEGYYISRIEKITLNDNSSVVIYDTTDNDASNDALPSGMATAEGAFVYPSEIVTHGIVVDVTTSPKMYNLKTTAVNSMISPDSPAGTYRYSYSNENLEVDFAALDGYKIKTIKVDGVDYDLTNLPPEVNVNTEKDANNADVIVSGEIVLDRKHNHEVEITADAREYMLTYVQYLRSGNPYIYDHYDSDSTHIVKFGENLPSPPVAKPGEAGNPAEIGGVEHVFNNWYKIADIKTDKTGEFRQLTVIENEKMPAGNLSLYGFWEATPNQSIGDPIQIEKVLEGTSEGTFKFVAVMEEHDVGNCEIDYAVNPAGEINVKLTASQKQDFINGEDIFVYEVKDETKPYIFDEARYVVKYDSTNDYLIYKMINSSEHETTPVSVAEFLNIYDSFKVKYNLAGGNIGGASTISDKTVRWAESNLLPQTAPVKQGYTFIGWAYGDGYVTNEDAYSKLAENDKAKKEITLVAYYEGDIIGENEDPYIPDDIPDKYQKVITYKIIGGTWDGANSSDIIEVVTLKDSSGNPSEKGTATLGKVPDSSAFVRTIGNAGDGEGWAEDPAPQNGTVVSTVAPLTFTYIFHNKPDVEYPKHEPDEPVPVIETEEYDDNDIILVIPNEGEWEFEGTVYTQPTKITLTDNVKLGNAVRENWVFTGWEYNDTPTAEQKTQYGAEIVAVYTAMWDKDEIGGDPDPNVTPDDVADKYQKIVKFKIVNGKWEDGTDSDKTFVVDLVTIGNKLSVDGAADITDIIPVNMTANAGYGSGAWDTTPPEKVQGTSEVTYTYSFTRNTGGSGGGGGGNRKYILSYETNGGNNLSSETYSSGTEVNLIKVPVKEGYAFEGWYLDKALTNNVTQVKMSKNITVYASWVEDNGGAGNGHKTPGGLNGKDHFAYVVGYPDGTVRPEANITRAEVTAIFFRLLDEASRNANLSEENGFGDVSKEAWYNKAVSTMTKLGVIKGRYEGGFVPDANITRAEFAAICARFDNSEYEIIDNFTDVSGHWAEADIHEAAAHGWIRGYEDKTFKPEQFITRAEAMTMINRVLNRVPEKADDLLAGMAKWSDNSDEKAWYYLAVQEATNSHEYKMKNNIYEKWVAIQENIDWIKYQ